MDKKRLRKLAVKIFKTLNELKPFFYMKNMFATIYN